MPDDGVEYRVTSWDAIDGLPQHSVTCIVETRDTHVWIGTFGGLARFDGATFETFGLDTPGLPSLRILSLHEDQGGDLWLGTHGGGVVRRRAGELRPFTLADGLPGMSVRDVATDGAGRLWVATDRGVAWRDGARFVSVSLGDETLVHRLVRRKDGSVVAAAASGVFALTPEGADRVGSFAVRAVAEDAAGRLWCAGEGHVFLLEGAQWRELALDAPPGLRIEVMCSTPNGGIWLGSNCGAALVVDAAAIDGRLDLSKLSPAPDPEATVHAIHVDSSGGIWIGWSMYGLHCARRAWTTGVRLRSTPGLDEVFAVAPHPEGGVWIGGRGLARMHGGRIELVPTPGHDAREVRALLPEPDGALWFTDEEELCKLSGAKVEVYGRERGIPAITKRAIVRSTHGELWVGSDRGLFRQREEGFVSVAPDTLGASAILALASTPDGGAWVGTADGAFLVAASGEVVHAITECAGSPAGEVRTLELLPDGTLWAGTYGRGLLRVRAGTAVRLGRDSGLFADALCAAALDDGTLYLSSNRGLFCCRLDELDRVADGESAFVPCRRLVGSPRVSEEGQGGNQPSVCRDATGGLWFVTIDGLAGVDVAASRSEVFPARCGILGVLAGEDYVEPRETLLLREGVRNIGIRLGASGFDPAVRARFEWRLGDAAPWAPVEGDALVPLVDLAPGEHRFEARCATASGRWSEPVALQLDVPERLSERVWFRLLLALGFTALCGGMLLFGARRGVRKSRRLEREVEARTAELSSAITRHRETAAQLEAARDELQERVRQRTEELVMTWRKQRVEDAHRERLEERMRQLQRLDNIRSMAGGVAHDFNNLFTVVLGASALLKTELGNNAHARALLDEIVAAGQRGSRQTQRLRMLASNKVAARTVIDLNVVVARVVEVLRSVAGEAIELHVTPAPRPARVLAATSQIEQVLMNLVDNARQAMPGGGRVDVVVQTFEDDEGQGRVRLRVTDTGAGMPQSVRDRAFEPFFTTWKEAEGAGLGLFTVAGIVKQLGGTVELTSDVGKGTSCDIVLPATEPAGGTDERDPARADVAGSILLVEDDPSVRNVVCRLLESLGYRVEAVATGEAAVAALQAADEPFAAILSDLMLPQMYGLELAIALRTAAPATGIVFMSGCIDLLDAHQDLPGPVLSKPPSLEELAHAIERVRSGQRDAV